MLFVRQEVFDFDAECNIPLTHDVMDIRTQLKKKIGLASWIRPINPQIAKGALSGKDSTDDKANKDGYECDYDFHRIPPKIVFQNFPPGNFLEYQFTTHYSHLYAENIKERVAATRP